MVDLVCGMAKRISTPSTASKRLVAIVICAVLAAITWLVFGQTLGHQFVSFDDPEYVYANKDVAAGLSLGGIAWGFTHIIAGNWHPITTISHMLDCQLYGLNASGHHFTNVLLHTIAVILLFLAFQQMTGSLWRSAFVAALFAIHPLHVESVAWASERKDTLSTLFGLLSLIAYVRYTEAPSFKRYAWVGITLALGLMAKPMLVTWPFVMLLLDYWPLRRMANSLTTKLRRGARCKGAATGITSLVWEKLPLFIIVVTSAVITFLAQSHEGAVRTLAHDPIARRLSIALVAYAKYLLLTFWPNDLAVYYPFAGIPAWQIISAALLLIGISMFCFLQRKSAPYLIVGWLWFLGTLVPVIGLVQVGGQIMADRYFYIPSIGLFIALVFGLADIARDWRVAPAISAGIAGGILLVLATLTNAQIQRWRNSFTLFEHTLAVTPPNLRIEHNLGVALGASDRYDEAAAHFAKALQIDPKFYDGLVAMGVTRAHQGQLREAIDYFQAAIRSQPDAPKARVQLAHALWNEKRDEEALEEMRRASQLAPKDADIRADFGLALALAGRIPEAIEQLHETLRTNPNHAEAHNNLGLALLASGKARESIPEFEATLRLKPELKGAAENLQRAHAQLGSER